MEINNIYKEYADKQNHAVYSIDESFLDVTDSLRMFGAKDANELARMIQIDLYKRTGIYTTIGIGDNPLLAKFALDLESKKILIWGQSGVMKTSANSFGSLTI